MCLSLGMLDSLICVIIMASIDKVDLGLVAKHSVDRGNAN